MKDNKLFAAMSGVFTACLFATAANAQVPSSITGDSILFAVTNGSGVLSASGYYLFVPSDSGSGYQIIGVGGITNSSGTYSYSASNSVGTLILSDSVFGAETNTLTFQTGSSGQFTLTAGTNQQTGTLLLATALARSSLAGHSFYVTAMGGAVAFASQGTAIFSATSATNYSALGTSEGVVNTEGTYAYSETNTTTGYFPIRDDVTGNSYEYFGFTGTNSGIYLVTQPYSGAYQVGTFTVSNLVPAMFFVGQVDLSTNVDWLQFHDGTPFGYFDVMDFQFPLFYHFDMGFEWYFDANNSAHGCYLYDFASSTFFYTAPATFPYLYDFTLNAWLYWFPDTKNPGRYTSNPRYFYNFGTGQIITK